MWASPVTIALFVGFLASAGAFVLVEKYWAQEPIFPVRLMVNFDILTTYSVGGLQALAQIAVSLVYNILCSVLLTVITFVAYVRDTALLPGCLRGIGTRRRQPAGSSSRRQRRRRPSVRLRYQ